MAAATSDVAADDDEQPIAPGGDALADVCVVLSFTVGNPRADARM